MFQTDRVDPRISFNRGELFTEVSKKFPRYSIGGIQKKGLCKVVRGDLTIVDSKGTHIIKPSPEQYPYTSENEHLTMTLLRMLGQDVAKSGLVPFKDGELCYITLRYDRIETPIHQEDMLQVMGISNSDSARKYDCASYEDVLNTVKKVSGLAATIPVFNRILCAYILGNGDFHLKNISVEVGSPVKLTPAYDFINTALYGNNCEIMALKLLSNGEPDIYSRAGKGLYYGGDFVQLAEKVGIPSGAARGQIQRILKLAAKLPRTALGLLPNDLEKKYIEVLDQRARFLEVFRYLHI
ncbi:HipA domain-containing protein [Hahella sp. CCB-MM4]|uniref:HipA domain-containing protein n=1 Tax=Hahella sp. (strain CCB-MM4) TaxID=1926491 RepID=UPI00143E0836|nr:HipA domain-containing protein [Hahella sp. CCB-MM4]